MKKIVMIVSITIICLSLYFLAGCDDIFPFLPTPEPTCTPTVTPAPPPAILQDYIKVYHWSPDSSQVALVISPGGNAWDCDLWVADRNLENLQLIKQGEVSTVTDWQGDWILFTKDREEGQPVSYYGAGEFWKIRSDGSGEIQLTDTYTPGNGIRTEYWNHAYDNMGTVSWAHFVPGMDLLYFVAHNGNGWYKSYTCTPDGIMDWKHISHPDYTWIGKVSPTGNKLFFASSANYYTDFTIKSANPDGTGVFTIKGPMKRCHFFILADGSGVVWNLAGVVYCIDIDASNERIILDDDYSNTAFIHGRNSNEVLMYSDRTDGNNHIYSLELDNSAVTQLTSGNYRDSNPIISPDGLYLGYQRVPDTYSGTTGVLLYELVIKHLD